MVVMSLSLKVFFLWGGSFINLNISQHFLFFIFLKLYFFCSVLLLDAIGSVPRSKVKLINDILFVFI